jgi:hypothetical protein
VSQPSSLFHPDLRGGACCDPRHRAACGVGATRPVRCETPPPGGSPRPPGRAVSRRGWRHAPTLAQNNVRRGCGRGLPTRPFARAMPVSRRRGCFREFLATPGIGASRGPSRLAGGCVSTAELSFAASYATCAPNTTVPRAQFYEASYPRRRLR